MFKMSGCLCLQTNPEEAAATQHVWNLGKNFKETKYNIHARMKYKP